MLLGKIVAKNIQDPLEVSSKLSQLFVLCNEARLDIKAIKNINNKIYLNAIDKIQFLLFNKPLLGTELSLIQSAISSDTLDIIAASGDLIKQSRLYKEIDKNQLEE
uniref:hypothetical protein n=1 Tax=Anaplasma marginale TaxID=770 RepID=UPI0005B5546A